MLNYIKVFSGYFIDIQRIFKELQNLNISAIVKDESEYARLGGLGSPFHGILHIHVHEDELERAKPVFENFLSELELEY
ncbi:DUF2007 domain-containing protein [Algibacter sp. AS12]|uniref:DUF2007 domain-containing protein n=1 Tax=Algibacter sp. AS12 TaxID=3135773 RepID=UPI00398B17C4